LLPCASAITLAPSNSNTKPNMTGRRSLDRTAHQALQGETRFIVFIALRTGVNLSSLHATSTEALRVEKHSQRYKAPPAGTANEIVVPDDSAG
jgi:hypothetical protein